MGFGGTVGAGATGVGAVAAGAGRLAKGLIVRRCLAGGDSADTVGSATGVGALGA